MTDCTSDFNSLLAEYTALGRHLGEVQQRCGALVLDLHSQVKTLQVQVMRLRAELLVRTTAAHDIQTGKA